MTSSALSLGSRGEGRGEWGSGRGGEREWFGVTD